MSSRLQAGPAIGADVPLRLGGLARGVAVETTVEEAGFPAEPWGRPHLAGLAAAQVLAAAVLAGAWFGLSDELVFTRQIPLLDLAVVATAAGGMANVAWIVQGRSAVRRRTAAFQRRVAVVLPATAAAPAASESAPAVAMGGGIVSAARMTRYHRPDCPLLDGKDVRPVSGTEQRDRRACGVCQPLNATAPAGEG